MRAVFSPDIRSGFSALSSYVKSAVDGERRAWVLIPDQMALTTERELSLALPPSFQLYCDTVSFSRLCNNIFRTLGGLSYNYADKGAEMLTLWRAMSSCRDGMLVYGDSLSDATSVPVLMSAITELKQSMISPERFMAAAAQLSLDPENSSLANKYIDVANVYAAYNELLSENYDDRIGDVTTASRLLSEHDFFGGGELIVFSFSSFTPQQYAILREAAKQCSQVTFIFTCPSEFAGERSCGLEYEGIVDTLRRLRVIADKARVPFKTHAIPSLRRDEAAELAASLWEGHAPIKDEIPDNISLYECAMAADEAELAAIEISRAVRSGMRYRDIAVVMGSPESYEGVIDRIFDEYRIPYHMSRRVAVETVPVAAAVLSALRVVTGGWRRDDIITFARTGFAGIGNNAIGDDAIDELELYLSTWNISGKRFRDPVGGGWSMNPDGYVSEWTEEGLRILDSVNASRRVLTSLLDPLAEAFSDNTTAKEKTAAVTAIVDAFTDDEASDGTTEEAQIAAILRRALAAIEIASPEGKMKAADYMCCLSLVLNTLTVATIPALSDEVDVSDPLRMRGAGYRLVIMLGCNDGVLPADVSDSGFFSDSDKIVLEGAGVTVGASGSRTAMELYNFSRVISSTYEKLIISYKTTKNGELPFAVSRVAALFPALNPIRYSGILTADDVYSGHGIRTCFTKFEDPALAAAARELLSENEDGRRILSGLTTPISDVYERISDEEALRLFGGDIRLSQSRLESFVLCKFGFFCKYVLSLAEKKRASLTYADIGTFIHAVLERVFREKVYKCDENELRRRVDAIIADYVREVLPSEEANNGRLHGLFRRLRRGVNEFMRSFRAEFAESLFTPVLFEVPIGLPAREGELSLPSMKIPLGDGTFAVMRGIADRIDTYRDGEGTLYLRVIDYKTGKKSFDPRDVTRGINLQLPLYMYTVAATDDHLLTEKLGGEPGDLLKPAGFLYVGVRPSDGKAVDGDDFAARNDDDVRRLPKSGLLLRDEAVLRAMDPALAGEYIPVKMKKDGSFYADSLKTAVSEEELDTLYRTMTDTVARIGAEMRSGCADAVPMRDPSSSPCDYCAMKAVCRSNGT